MARPTLSVVLPTYNHAEYLPRMIDSVLAQTRPPDEFIILDDASTDDSQSILQEYAARCPLLRVERNPQNLGVNVSNRKLFEMASGDYIQPAAADDFRFPRFFEHAMRMAEQHPQAGVIFGQISVQNERDEEIGFIDVPHWKEAGYISPARFLEEYVDRMLATHAISPAAVYRRAALAEVGWYREELGPWADSFAARACGLKYGVCYVPELFSVDRRLSRSYSQQVKDDPSRQLAYVGRAAKLMRSEEFRDLFSEASVRRWESGFRRLAAWNYFLGNDSLEGARRPSFVVRNFRRLPRAWKALWIAVRSPKVD